MHNIALLGDSPLQLDCIADGIRPQLSQNPIAESVSVLPKSVCTLHDHHGIMHAHRILEKHESRVGRAFVAPAGGH